MTTVMAFGDSILKGVVNEGGKYTLCDGSFVRLCEKTLGLAIQSKAKFGGTVQWGQKMLERCREEIRASTGRFVLLEFGGNDSDYDWQAVSENPKGSWQPHCPREEFIRLYEQMIEDVRNLGKLPLLLSLPPIDSRRYFRRITNGRNAAGVLSFLGGRESYLEYWHEGYNLELFRLAARQGVPLADITTPFLERRNFNKLLCEDGIHPNAEGHALIASALCTALAAAV